MQSNDIDYQKRFTEGKARKLSILSLFKPDTYYTIEQLLPETNMSRLLTATKIRKYYQQGFLKRKELTESKVTVIDNILIELPKKRGRKGFEYCISNRGMNYLDFQTNRTT